MCNRVENDLRPHNQQTIEKILEFYKTSNKCCAIQATGTGKTFLILRLLEIYNDAAKTAVIFAPNHEIIKQTQKKMKQFKLTNAIFCTYQKLARMTDAELKSIQTDLIICDELHRTGAKTWGEKFERFVEYHPNSKVFGVTATPLRCADGRDMAEEYFDGNRACDISLAEALVRKIIPTMPVYVSALYTFEEEYNELSKKIKYGLNLKNEKEFLKNELKEAKEQLEKSIGIPQIIKKYIKNYNGKYIVFCKNKNHLYKMKDLVIKWFRDSGYNGDLFSYIYYSRDNSIKEDFLDFKNNQDKGLKLLFVIDCLNEGLHLDSIDGCILLRTTTSNIIYYQQIGRVIDAGCKDTRIILDLVSNCNALRVFNLKKELENKIIERKSGHFSDCDKNFDINEFHIEDYVQTCIETFNKIDCLITRNDWSEYEINILKKYNNCISKNKDKILNELKGRSWNSIILKASKLGLNTGYKWSKDEDILFQKLYEKYGIKAYDMMPNKNRTQCNKRRIKLNLDTYGRISNKNTDELIKKYYPIMGSACVKFIQNMTAQQIQNRANALGIYRVYRSKYKYVSYSKRMNKWRVRFRLNGKEMRFGYFDNEDEAGKVAMEKAKEYGKI